MGEWIGGRGKGGRACEGFPPRVGRGRQDGVRFCWAVVRFLIGIHAMLSCLIRILTWILLFARFLVFTGVYAVDGMGWGKLGDYDYVPCTLALAFRDERRGEEGRGED